MTIIEALERARELLQSKGRISYRLLKAQCELDDDTLETLKDELIEAQRVAVDENGKVLVWIGASPVSSFKFQVPNQNVELRTGNSELSPAIYTPPHLADRIRAVNVTDGERKTITALFADLKGSTALIEGLDPEEARAIIDPALQLMMEAVHRYEGYVAQALGDGIFALFGAPLAHEDHPQRALYAALRMQEEMQRYGDEVRRKHGVPLAMRVGINTGEVVVRSIRKDDGHADYIPVGHSINLAARMEQLATPGSILMTAYTHTLTEGYFACKALGQMHIKGVEEPLDVYEVLGVGPLRTRLQVSATRRGLTRFIGRQREMAQLYQALSHAKAGQGQIVGVMGEAGLGKSRLFHEFVEAYGQSPLLVLPAYSVSHGKAFPYLPVIELLKSYFRIELRDDERTRRQKVIGKVLELDRTLEETLPYLLALLGSEDQPSPLQQMDPHIRRHRTFAALKKLLLRESLNQPVILIFEDLHWTDSETQEFLDTLSEGITAAKILLLVNYRPEYRHEWGQKTYCTQLRLVPFGQVEAAEFLDELLGRTPELTALKQQILSRTDGTPFFIEEVVQELREQGRLVAAEEGAGLQASPTLLPVFQLPTTVQGILAARIDRLAADEKALLQQLAVIGREFSLGLIRQVVACSEDDLYRLLSGLQRKEFLYERQAFPEVEYLFKHSLTQEVAYNSVLIEQRKALHEQTALALERLFADQLEEHYRELAHHYRHSRNTEKAIAYLQKVGQQVSHSSAHVEAVGYFTTALDLLTTLPHTPERAQWELSLQLRLAASLQVTKGPSAREVGNAYRRALELCHSSGDERQSFAALHGLWLLHHVQADLRGARDTAEQLLAMAEASQDSMLLLEARRTLGSTLLWQGEFARARVLLEQAVAQYKSDEPDSEEWLSSGVNRGVVCLCELARALWLLGYPDQGLLKSQAAVSWAREALDPFSLAFALVFAAGLHQLRREATLTQSNAQAGILLAREHGFTALVSAGTIRHGWALAQQGHGEEGLRQMHEGLTARQAAGAELAQPYFLALQAEIYGNLGQNDRALTLLTQALSAMTASGEHRLEAELYRLRGELTLQKALQVAGPPFEVLSNTLQPTLHAQAEAEECFLKALDIAQKQQAKSLELRAVVCLARLWQQQGKPHEAHQRLSEIYHWFTEGFATKDLQEAKSILQELELAKALPGAT